MPCARRVALVCVALAIGVLACGPRTVAVVFDDGRGGQVRVPDPAAPFTAVAFCTPSRTDACRSLAAHAKALRAEHVTLVLVGVPESDGEFMTQPIAPAVVAELRAQGAYYGCDLVGDTSRTWLAVGRSGGAVIARDGEIVWREPDAVLGDQLVEKSIERARRHSFVDALPGPGTVVAVLSGLLTLGTIALVLVVRPRPFARSHLALGVPFSLRTKARRKRTALWLADSLSLSNGEPFDTESWPEGLGTWLDLRVTVDGRVVVEQRVEVGAVGPSGLSYAALTINSRHSATKHLLRFDTPPGADIEIAGMLTPMAMTVVHRAELLVA